MSNDNAKPESDTRRKWEFTANEGRWSWTLTRPDGAVERSEPFATLAECTADARLHGYVAWRSEDERRRDLQLEVTKALRQP